jgi:hypothetical protein
VWPADRWKLRRSHIGMAGWLGTVTTHFDGALGPRKAATVAKARGDDGR